ncbi:MAG: PIN domain-containing protein [Acidobacteria bacterium]|nr:MAG: PIN domain-containing protein [Acidobacteriota bacterium]REK01102.1 MAG: PIN domain-containing protein [Acidobacteriota bacterium]
MSVDSFLDTNVLVYAAAPDPSHPDKTERALQLIENEAFGVSAQVLQEFYVTVVRKATPPLPPEVALEWIEQLEAFPCIQVEPSLIKIAALTSFRYRISYWDAAIVAAAEALGAPVLFTEDLSDGQRYGSLEVRNPFL